MIQIAPEGATINSIVAVAQAMEQAIRPSRGPSTILLGFGGAADLGAQCLTAARSHRDVLRLHTMAPLLLALLDSEAAEQVTVSMLTSLDVPTRSLRDFGIAPRVRRCPACVQEDQEKYGFAYARVIHQLGPVVQCPTHRVNLEEVCASCEAPFALFHPRGYIAQDHGRHLICACSECGSTAGVPLLPNVSEGYEDFVGHLSRALQASAPVLRPSARFHVIAHAAEEARKRHNDIDKSFAAYWGCTSMEQAAAAACIRPAQLRSAFSGKKAPYDPYGVIAVVGFAIHILREWGVDYVGDFSPISGVAASARDSSKVVDWFVEELCAVADEIGLPQQAALLLARGSSINTVRAYGHSEARLRHFMDKLPAEHRREIRIRQRRRNKGLPICTQSMNGTKGVKRRQVLELLAALEKEAPLGTSKANSLRTRIRVRNLSLYNWMRLYDREWFNETVPQSPAGGRREMPATTVESARSWLADAGLKSLPELRVRSPMMFRWLWTNDREWLCKTLPSGDALKARDLTPQDVRRIVVEAIDCGATSEHGIRRYAAAAKKLALSKDETWFRNVMDVLSAPFEYAPGCAIPTKELVPREGLLWARYVVQIAMASGIVADGDLRMCAPVAYALIHASDQEWLGEARAAAVRHAGTALWAVFFQRRARG